MKKTVAEAIASRVVAIRNCKNTGNTEWAEKHQDALDALVREHMPSGSGIDSGTTILIDRTGATRITLACQFHHMNEHGVYDGWTAHQITARPEFIGGLRIQVSGQDRNGIKDYLADVYHHALTHTIDA